MRTKFLLASLGLLVVLTLGVKAIFFGNLPLYAEAMDDEKSDEKEGKEKEVKKDERNPVSTNNEAVGKKVDIVKVPLDAFKANGGTSAVAGPGSIELWTSLIGEIRLNGDRYARVFPRFAGIVKDVLVGPGTQVKKGATLAILEGNESLSRLHITSPVSGTVIDRHVTLGEVVRDDSEVFVVADLDSVWLDLVAYSHDLPGLAVGQTVKVQDEKREIQSGTISFISPVLSGRTRSAVVRATIQNKNGGLRPGSFVKADVLSKKFDVPVAVVKGSVQKMNDHEIIFVPVQDGFEVRAVNVGQEDDSKTEITSGLSAGESYVATGSLILKSELSKADSDDDK